jgi:glycosyltransferase involved in cell wall biosynthesis
MRATSHALGQVRTPANGADGLLTVIVPVFNEVATVEEAIRRVRSIDVAKEIIIVDDGSTDGTADRLAQLDGVVLLAHGRNRGKGAAIRTALERATGDVVIIQDADLEYDPRDIPALYARFRSGDVMAVYGSRVLKRGHRISSWLYYWGGRSITLVTRLLYGIALTDEPTGYKLLATDTLRSFSLDAEGFDFCAQLTARILRNGGRIVELPIDYHPRSRAEGKKITARDGLIALWVLTRERWRPRILARPPLVRESGDRGLRPIVDQPEA